MPEQVWVDRLRQTRARTVGLDDTHRGVKQQLHQDLVLDNAASLDGLEEAFECRVRHQAGQFVFADQACKV